MKKDISDTQPENSPLDERTIDVIASEWLSLREGGLSPEDDRKLRQWLALDPRHQAAFSRLERVWTLFGQAAGKGLLERTRERAQARIRRRRSAVRYGAAVLASLIVLAVGTRYWPRGASEGKTNEELVITDPAKRLPDGSIVELRPATRIAVGYEPSVRRVRILSGEAHFQVMKDPQRPFVVETHGVRVRAVGTAFSVRLRENEVEVLVTEGRVSIAKGAPSSPSSGAVSEQSPNSAFVDAGNRAVVDFQARDNPIAVAPLGIAEAERQLEWRAIKLQFDGEMLGHAVELLNKRNRLQIVLEEESLSSLRISGTFRADNPEGFARIIGETFDLRLRRQKDYVVVLSKD